MANKKNRTRRKDEKVYKKGRIRFMGGDERAYIADIDEEELLRDILKKRVKLQKPMGDVSVIKICEGHAVKFTQKQSRSLLMHVSSGEGNYEQHG